MSIHSAFLFCTLVVGGDADKLLKDLASPDDEVVDAAEEALAKIGKSDSSIVKKLVVILKSSSRAEKFSAASILLRIGPNSRPAIPALTARFRDGKEDDSLRRMCSHALGMIGGADATKNLKMAVHAKDPFVRLWAADSLPTLVREQPELLKELIPMFAHEDGAVRETLASNLSELDPKLANDFTAALTDKNPLIRVLAGKVLIRMRKDSDQLIAAQIAFLDDENPMVRNYAASSLWETRKPRKAAVPKLIKMLSDKEPDNRSIAIYVLGDLGKDAADSVGPVLERIKDKDSEVRSTAIKILPKIDDGSPAVIKGLGGLLTKDEHPDIILWTILALGEFGPRAKVAVEALKTMQSDERFRRYVDLALDSIEK